MNKIKQRLKEMNTNHNPAPIPYFDLLRIIELQAEALEFYGNKANWTDQIIAVEGERWENQIKFDREPDFKGSNLYICGKRSREALQKTAELLGCSDV